MFITSLISIWIAKTFNKVPFSYRKEYVHTVKTFQIIQK